VHGFDIVDTPRTRRDAAAAAGSAGFIRAKRDAPFLLVASFLNPHNICEWARGQSLSEGDIGVPPPLDQCPPLRPNHAPQQNEPDIVALMRRSYHNTRTFPVGNFDERKWREYIWAYYRMIELVDARIGEVLQALRQAGLEENTLIVLTADHGDLQGAHRWNQKTVFYDEAARVPWIVSYKGVTARGVSERLVHTGVDLMPTLCDYAGIGPPAGLPGLSLKETANGKSRKDPREFLVVSNRMVQGGPVDGVTPKPDGRMLRSQRYKYCAYSEGRRRESLVDMEQDPGEMVNLAGDPKHRATLERHRRLLAGWCAKYGDGFAVPS
jgi:arylsulfatase A-like enzyme